MAKRHDARHRGREEEKERNGKGKDMYEGTIGRALGRA